MTMKKKATKRAAKDEPIYYPQAETRRETIKRMLKESKANAKKKARANRAAKTSAYRPDHKTKSAPATAAKSTRSAPMMTERNQNEDLEASVAALEKDNQDLTLKNEELDAKVAALEKDNQDLTLKNEELDAKVAELEGELSRRDAAALTGDPGANVTPITGKRFIRGKLPGDRLVKVDTLTNVFTPVDKEEWDSLA